MIGSLLLSSLVVLFSASHPTAQKSSPGASRLADGDYLRTDYMDAVVATQSARAADRFGEIQMMVLSRCRDGTEFLEIDNFHEGGARWCVTATGELKVIEDAVSDLQGLRVTVHSAESFTVEWPGVPARTFAFVGSAERWTASHTIVGTYRDTIDRRYEFRRDGTAQFPDTLFSFTYAVDHVLNPFDYIHGPGYLWCVRLQGDTLRIYDTTGDLGQVVAPSPQLVLHRERGPAGK